RQHSLGGVEVLAASSGERIPVGGGDPDRGRTADRERAYGLGHLRRRSANELDLLVRQAPLIEEQHGVTLQPHDLFGRKHGWEATGRLWRVALRPLEDVARAVLLAFEKGEPPRNARDDRPVHKPDCLVERPFEPHLLAVERRVREQVAPCWRATSLEQAGDPVKLLLARRNLRREPRIEMAELVQPA